MAEREGFEPPIPFRVCLISSQVHSTGLCHLSVLLSYFFCSHYSIAPFCRLPVICAGVRSGVSSVSAIHDRRPMPRARERDGTTASPFFGASSGPGRFVQIHPWPSRVYRQKWDRCNAVVDGTRVLVSVVSGNNRAGSDSGHCKDCGVDRKLYRNSAQRDPSITSSAVLPGHRFPAAPIPDAKVAPSYRVCRS
jgi:hypothetical protein